MPRARSGRYERVGRRDHGASLCNAARVHREDHTARIAVYGKALYVLHIERKRFSCVPDVAFYSVHHVGKIAFKGEGVFSRRKPAAFDHFEHRLLFFDAYSGSGKGYLYVSHGLPPRKRL